MSVATLQPTAPPRADHSPPRCEGWVQPQAGGPRRRCHRSQVIRFEIIIDNPSDPRSQRDTVLLCASCAVEYRRAHAAQIVAEKIMVTCHDCVPWDEDETATRVIEYEVMGEGGRRARLYKPVCDEHAADLYQDAADGHCTILADTPLITERAGVRVAGLVKAHPELGNVVQWLKE